MNVEFEIESINRRLTSLKREVRQKSKLWDTVCSAPWQRLWWFLQGFRLYKVGRWYRKTDSLK